MEHRVGRQDAGLYDPLPSATQIRHDELDVAAPGRGVDRDRGVGRGFDAIKAPLLVDRDPGAGRQCDSGNNGRPVELIMMPRLVDPGADLVGKTKPRRRSQRAIPRRQAPD